MIFTKQNGSQIKHYRQSLKCVNCDGPIVFFKLLLHNYIILGCILLINDLS